MATIRDAVVLAVFIQLLLSGVGPVHAQSTSAPPLQGTWKNVSIHVEINTYKGSDTSAVFSANESNWETKLKIKPIRTQFKSDGSYTSRYYTPDDSLVMERSGTWSVDGDTLIMQENHPDDTRYVNWLNVEGDTAHFETMLDWDSDGKKDDYYQAVQVRIN